MVSGRCTLQSIRDHSYIRPKDEPIRERDDVVRERRDVVPDEDALRDLGPVHNVDLELFVRIVREWRGVVAFHRAEPDDHVVPSRTKNTLKGRPRTDAQTQPRQSRPAKSAGPDLPGPGDLRAGPGVGVREGVHGDVGPLAADSVGDGVDGAQ